MDEDYGPKKPFPITKEDWRYLSIMFSAIAIGVGGMVLAARSAGDDINNLFRLRQQPTQTTETIEISQPR